MIVKYIQLYNIYENIYHKIIYGEKNLHINFMMLRGKFMLSKKTTIKIAAALSLTALVSTFAGLNPLYSIRQTTVLAAEATQEMFAIAANGARIKIDKVNSTRSGPMIVLYTDAFGAKTKTNQWGIEVQVDATGTVTYIRNLGVGDQSGIDIPKRGFVLSSYSAAYNKLLTDNFKVGDKVSLEGIQLIALDKSASYNCAAVNPNAVNNPAGVDATGVPFPGYRGADQLVVYTPEWRTASTGTNSYGYEVRVRGTLEDGTVTEVGGNDSAIPADGYVLSAHGAGANFLINNAIVGAKVKYDASTKKLSIIVTPNSLVSAAENDLKSVENNLSSAREALYDIPVDKAEEAVNAGKININEAKGLLDKIKADPNNNQIKFAFLDLLDLAKANTSLANYRTMESRKVEGRAVWHRPSDKDLEGVKKVLDELVKNNFNTVFLETFWQGYSIFPSKVQYVKQHPLFVDKTYGEYDNNLLKAYVEEGKKRGIEVHAWCEDFFVGEASMKPQSPILEQKPEWALVNYDGTVVTKKEGGNYLFMDPSIPEVRQLLKDLYKEIVRDYGVQGLQLDYIRYSVGHYKNDSGYGEYSVNAFKKAYNIPEDSDIKNLMDKDSNPDTWQDYYNKWNTWKQNNITSFVKDIRDELKNINADVILSTAIFPSTSEAKDTKMQDWPSWVQNGWIDLTTPMAYFKDTKTVQNSVFNMVKFVDGNSLNYAGVAPTFMGLEAKTNADQTRAAQLGLAQGSAIFASQNVLGLTDVQTVLAESTYRNSAVLPHTDLEKVIDTSLADIQSKVLRLYMPNGKMTKSDNNQLNARFNNIRALKTTTFKDVEKIQEKINDIIASADKYAKGAAKDRIVSDLVYLNSILKIRINMLERTAEYRN